MNIVRKVMIAIVAMMLFVLALELLKKGAAGSGRTA